MPEFFGSKWGDPDFGTQGGVVTWSLLDGGVNDFGGEVGFGGPLLTSDAEAITSFNVNALLRLAFSTWSDIADITFVQVADDGEVSGAGFAADIRITFSEIDGDAGTTLGQAFAPFSRPVTFAGDITFDAEERALLRDRAAFLEVAAHEIGHSIGLRHVEDPTALMFDTLRGDVDGPRADDIEGAREIYGREDPGFEPLRMTDRAPDLTILQPIDGLRVFGTEDGNRIAGTLAAERFMGAGGDDQLIGRGGDDLLRGGRGDDTLKGGLGADRLIGAGGRDVARGGAGEDLLIGGGQADRLLGGGGADDLRGGGGADVLNGGGGADRLAGGGGADRFVAADGGALDLIRDFRPGLDLLDFSKTGAERFADLTIEDGAGGLEVTGPAGGGFVLAGLSASEVTAADVTFAPIAAAPPPEAIGSTITGTAAPEALSGTEGDDTILGLGGDDTLFGFDGDDLLDGGPNTSSGAEVFGRPPDDIGRSQQLFGGDGDDTLVNGFELFGGAGDDLLIGGATEDMSLLGGEGNDTLVSIGEGHELLGGPGADVIVFSIEDPTTDGNVVGFEPGVDLIDLSEIANVGKFSDLAIRGGNGAHGVNFGVGDFELFSTTADHNLSAADFIFAV